MILFCIQLFISHLCIILISYIIIYILIPIFIFLLLIIKVLIKINFVFLNLYLTHFICIFWCFYFFTILDFLLNLLVNWAVWNSQLISFLSIKNISSFLLICLNFFVFFHNASWIIIIFMRSLASCCRRINFLNFKIINIIYFFSKFLANIQKLLSFCEVFKLKAELLCYKLKQLEMMKFMSCFFTPCLCNCIQTFKMIFT